MINDLGSEMLRVLGDYEHTRTIREKSKKHTRETLRESDSTTHLDTCKFLLAY